MLTWTELHNSHKAKIKEKENPEMIAFQADPYTFFTGEKEHPLLKNIKADLDDFDKRIIISFINSKLKELVQNHLAAIIDGNHEFLMKSSALVDAVVLPAITAVGKHLQPHDRLDPMVVWGAWACVLMLRGHGWEVLERPTKLTTDTENGQPITNFDTGLFDFILVRMDPKS
jgi:hypothetical protein